MPSVSGVTPLTHRKVITTKSALSVVARHATKRARRGVVVKRLRSAYLNAPRHTRPHAMTFIATQPFGFIVLCMAEADPKSRRRLTRSDKTTGFMTDAARRNILVAGLCTR